MPHHPLIARRSLLLLFLALAAGARAAEPAGPRQNLQVELRWVESAVSGAAIAGVRQGAVVVGTAGSVALRPGGLSLSTRRQEDEAAQIQRIVVLNGHAASILLSETELLQWLDYGVELRGSAPGQVRLQAQSRSLPVERQRGFALTPHWPGGRQPVRVELRALGQPGQMGQMGQTGVQTELLSTVQLPLGDWLTVARSGAATRAPEPGVIRSSDAESQRSRELQLRVSLLP